ncbi:putative selenate reductase subunit YgfK [bacterium]|nr:putative selenate reductase subunit YgfK [candidate division CSSED10-310 bacterium]
MSDIMIVQPFEVIFTRMLKEWETRNTIFGIHKSQFYYPQTECRYHIPEIFGHFLETPVGPAAGPHTQLSQNIISAWLCGGRFIELKTVQIMDELEIPRPCIDMEDEGYNVEWSQELKLNQSTGEYVKAWVLIHVLREILEFGTSMPFGTVFNISVGYNLEGISSEPMIRFMETMADASEEIDACKHILKKRFPDFADIQIPSEISNNVTLSTMHGCPPEEIENIARFLMMERHLHTTVKLNPTLLGKSMVMDILHHSLGFTDIVIPDSVFENDLSYDRALEMIEALQKTAESCGVRFGVKLSNTLAMKNVKGYLPGNEMYMSGRALYPLTINLLAKLQSEFNGRLNISFSAGADSYNILEILSSGAYPVSVATDVLKPGGYAKFKNYIDSIKGGMETLRKESLPDLMADKVESAQKAASKALQEHRYKKSYHPFGLPKVESTLTLFDCITAPCVEKCAVKQNVPGYAWCLEHGDADKALSIVLEQNPLPMVTGYVCTHLCQTRCTRNNYDEPVQIRSLKRFAAENGRANLSVAPPNGRKIAIIGSGPSGLAASYFLALNGFKVTVFEAKDRPGGMLALAPDFRLPKDRVQSDIDRIRHLGVTILCSQPITESPDTLLNRDYDAVYVACGYPLDAETDIDGNAAYGVLHALEVLESVAANKPVKLGSRVVVVGGGNTAMDVARTASRLTESSVRVIYRRSIHEMPAEKDEIEALREEGNILDELVSPLEIISKNNCVTGIRCIRNRLGAPGEDGRCRPEPVEGSEFTIDTDTVIFAVGQQPDMTLLSMTGFVLTSKGAIQVDQTTGSTSKPGVYAGGDAVRGPAIIIEACADGRRAAESICRDLNVPFLLTENHLNRFSEAEIWDIKRRRIMKVDANHQELLPPYERNGFQLVEQTLSKDYAVSESKRCLQCDVFCDKCVDVCPNRANEYYLTRAISTELPVFVYAEGMINISKYHLFHVEQNRQVIHIEDFCNACGNCATFCVHQGKPYLDKPRLFLDKSEYENEQNNAFHVKNAGLVRRENGQEYSITEHPKGYVFETEALRVLLTRNLTVENHQLKKPFETPVDLRRAAEMIIIYEGIKDSLSFLLELQAGEQRRRIC